jgi:hypothetical protein
VAAIFADGATAGDAGEILKIVSARREAYYSIPRVAAILSTSSNATEDLRKLQHHQIATEPEMDIPARVLERLKGRKALGETVNLLQVWQNLLAQSKPSIFHR